MDHSEVTQAWREGQGLQGEPLLILQENNGGHLQFMMFMGLQNVTVRQEHKSSQENLLVQNFLPS